MGTNHYLTRAASVGIAHFHSQRGHGQNSVRAVFVNSRIGTNIEVGHFPAAHRKSDRRRIYLCGADGVNVFDFFHVQIVGFCKSGVVRSAESQRFSDSGRNISQFPRNLAPDFTHYLNRRPNMRSL